MPLRTESPQPGTSTTPAAAASPRFVDAALSSGPATAVEVDYPLGWHGDQA